MDMQKILPLHSLVFNLEWDDSQKRKLPSEYTNLPMHIALEKTDMERKWDIFLKMMGKDSHTKIVLLHHIKNTTFDWGCKHEEFWSPQYRDLYNDCYSLND